MRYITIQSIVIHSFRGHLIILISDPSIHLHSVRILWPNSNTNNDMHMICLFTGPVLKKSHPDFFVCHPTQIWHTFFMYSNCKVTVPLSFLTNKRSLIVFLSKQPGVIGEGIGRSGSSQVVFKKRLFFTFKYERSICRPIRCELFVKKINRFLTWEP